MEIVPGRVFIEIVTLDSEGCAPCQYMCEAVRSVEKHYGKRLLWRETLIKSLAGIRRTQKLGVSTLPTLLINNEIVFDNLVPTREEQDPGDRPPSFGTTGRALNESGCAPPPQAASFS